MQLKLKTVKGIIIRANKLNVVFQTISEHDAPGVWHDADTELNREINIQPRLSLEAVRHRQVWPPQFRSRPCTMGIQADNTNMFSRELF